MNITKYAIVLAASWSAAPAAKKLIVDSGFRRIIWERQKQRRAYAKR